MANESLSKAKDAKNDEFYTQYHDIEREVEAYLEYNADVFRDKTVLLPCDEPSGATSPAISPRTSNGWAFASSYPPAMPTRASATKAPSS